ncbi:hypothetical protein ILUMI_06493 [Ignelater luminosus]|uniref:C2H2-type domain-containing protein n=1 Tax=Ignelater luminosus TaxID=2038154 RepID=A0A8K0GHP6_IGNLU|nr:hypothetical protein ILUMI_06493 [Ignelater luminosus]
MEHEELATLPKIKKETDEQKQCSTALSEEIRYVNSSTADLNVKLEQNVKVETVEVKFDPETQNILYKEKDVAARGHVLNVSDEEKDNNILNVTEERNQNVIKMEQEVGELDIKAKEKRFKCIICNYKTSQSNCLIHHMRTHTGERPYVCAKCDYRAAQKSTLKKHMNVHYDGVLKCKKCDYNTFQRKSLQNHMRIHVTEKNFKCDECEPPYKCNNCNYNTVLKSRMKEHLKVNHNVSDDLIKKAVKRPNSTFMCYLCDYKCTLKKYLQTHMQYHIEGKDFKCEICNYRSLQQHDVSKHISQSHPFEVAKVTIKSEIGNANEIKEPKSMFPEFRVKEEMITIEEASMSPFRVKSEPIESDIIEDSLVDCILTKTEMHAEEDGLM